MKKCSLFAAHMTMAMSLTFAISAFGANEPRPVNVRAFDVGGVKSGMDYNQALAAMAKNFGVPPSQITSSDGGDLFASITGTRVSATLVYEKDGTRMQVDLVPRLPLDKAHPMVVTQIQYEIPWTKQNETEMAKAARAKYGEPSMEGAGVIKWCEQPIPIRGMGCVADKAEMSVGSTKLTMHDPAWMDAFQKFLADKKATKPKL